MDNSFKIWSLTLVLLLVSSCGDGHRADYSLDATKDYVEKKLLLKNVPLLVMQMQKNY